MVGNLFFPDKFFLFFQVLFLLDIVYNSDGCLLGTYYFFKRNFAHFWKSGIIFYETDLCRLCTSNAWTTWPQRPTPHRTTRSPTCLPLFWPTSPGFPRWNITKRRVWPHSSTTASRPTRTSIRWCCRRFGACCTGRVNSFHGSYCPWCSPTLWRENSPSVGNFCRPWNGMPFITGLTCWSSGFCWFISQQNRRCIWLGGFWRILFQFVQFKSVFRLKSVCIWERKTTDTENPWNYWWPINQSINRGNEQSINSLSINQSIPHWKYFWTTMNSLNCSIDWLIDWFDGFYS